MELHQIRYFLALCDTLNFTRAAEQCHVTQPALSRAIRGLEQEVGGLLFRRERNLTHLTDLGQLVRPRLEQAMQQMQAVKETAKSFLNVEQATLRLGIMCTIGPLRFAGFLARFRADNPGIELALIEGVPETLSAMLESGELDVAVMGASDDFPERFDVQTLYGERYVLAFPAGHRFARMNAVPLRELNNEPYLRRINCEHGDYFDTIGESCGVNWNVIYRSEREDWIQIMVGAGLGVCLIPEYSAVLGGVQTRPVIDPPVEREVALVTVSGRRFSPAVGKFVASVKSYRWPAGSDGTPIEKVAAAQ
jgi:DNA-binding transcriptional LysR family regulator